MKLLERQGKVKEIRDNDQVPGVIYGHGIDPTPIQVEYQDLRKAMAKYGTSMTFEVTLGKDKHLVYIKDYQSDYLSNYKTIHVDFMKVSADDTISAAVSLNFLNKDAVRESGQVIATNLTELEVEYKVGKGVSSIDVDLSVLKDVDAIHVEDVVLPEGLAVLNDPKQIVANLATIAEEVEATDEVDNDPLAGWEDPEATEDEE
ncbi:50S ribosomal protein L25 [Candidatus Xianfuyuplasma coldseepsis]|uniref:50S ribosomal protein L25 n=1 Tax=Candidatus Xianfuyuplasma coldseepsis TaxID=2782163 RepID=A0A7L7KP81_9MOLU|nr:50S ribosomal protein L25 [Xianfuyuplasma coldseepsis]QMS84600.1 50S ribosomal protein L25 [Xianfuyuplasma coldseepsis]